MEEELAKLSSPDLMELYQKNSEFLSYLEKEYEGIESKKTKE